MVLECLYVSVMLFLDVFGFFLRMRLGHASKNASGQLASPLRNIMWGRHFTDHSASRQLGLPVSAFARAEAQSDYLNACLWNPFYLVKTPDARPEQTRGDQSIPEYN